MPPENEEHEEIEVTEIIERLENLEKESSGQKEEIKRLEKILGERLTDCEESLDALADKIGGKN